MVLLLNLGLLLYYSPTLTLVAVGVALLSATVTIVSGLMILRHTRRILALRGKFFGLMVQAGWLDISCVYSEMILLYHFNSQAALDKKNVPGNPETL